MSKLQKKKPSDKKKKKVGAEHSPESQAKEASKAKSIATGSVPKPKVEKPVAESGSTNLFTKAAEFLREVKVELKKVTWPTRKQTTGTTIVVIVFVFVVAAFLGLFDYGLSRLVQVVLT